MGHFSAETALHAGESLLVLCGAGSLRVFGHVVDALKEVRHLGFATFRVASATIRRLTGSIELGHLSTAQDAILVAIDQSLEPI